MGTLKSIIILNYKRKIRAKSNYAYDNCAYSIIRRTLRFIQIFEIQNVKI